MALVILQSGREPLGQFDGYATTYLNIKGGEVVTFLATAWPGGDPAAQDALDGYVPNTNAVRPAVSQTLSAGSRPLFLSDDGSAGSYSNGFAGAAYGTLFGTVVGGIAGQVVTGGAVLGPHTATGSGKVTLWDKPGLYGVTLDAVDTSLSTGVVPGNTSLTVGSKLGATATGLLTMASNGTIADSANKTVAYLVEFSTGNQLVTTPNYLVAALNSPSSSVSSAQARAFKFAVINWLGGLVTV